MKLASWRVRGEGNGAAKDLHWFLCQIMPARDSAEGDQPT